MSGLRRPALAFLLAAVGAAAAAPQNDVAEFTDLDLRLTISSPWPDHLSQGFRPLLLEFENESSREHLVELVATASNWGSLEHRVTRGVRVGPGARAALELSVPAFGLQGSNYRVEAEVGTDTRYLFLGGGGPIQIEVDPLLVLTRQDPAQAELDGWTARLARKEVDRHGTKLQDVSLAALDPDRAPRRFEAYTSLRAVIVDTRGFEPAALPDAVLSWARLGGTLAFLGPGALRLAESVAGVREWLEPRFQLDASGDVYQLGRGRVLVGVEDDFLGSADEVALRQAIDDAPNVVPGKSAPRYVRALPIPGMRDLPYRLFVLLLIGFAMLVGPVNFAVVKATGRPAWLLVTIPVLAVLAAGGILAYGVLYQGVDLREAEETYTLLDQRTHVADTLELRAFFAGLSPSDGLRPGPRTAVLPHGFGSGSMESLFLVDVREGPVLSGEFLPVRREGKQVVLSERSARGRLLLTRTGEDTLLAENGLGVAVEQLLVRGADGWTYLWQPGEDAAPLAEGERAELVRQETSRLEVLDEWLPKPSDERDLGWSAGLPRSSYVARVTANPFADDTGLVPDRVLGAHVVFGVLPQDEEDWR